MRRIRTDRLRLARAVRIWLARAEVRTACAKLRLGSRMVRTARAKVSSETRNLHFGSSTFVAEILVGDNVVDLYRRLPSWHQPMDMGAGLPREKQLAGVRAEDGILGRSAAA